MAKNNSVGTEKPDLPSGILQPAEPSAFAGTKEPDLALGIPQPAKHWGVDLGGSGKGCETYDGKHFGLYPTPVDVAIAMAADGAEEARIERTDIPFGMEKMAMKAEFNSRGIRLVQVNPARTAQYRKAKKIGKTDRNDAFVIYHLKCDFSEPREVSDEWIDFSVKVNKHTNALRYSNVNTSIKRTLKKIFGRGNIPKEVLTSSGALSGGALAFIIARLHTNGRRTAERLGGVYGNGHSCQLRAEIQRGLANARKRGIRPTAYRSGLRRLGSMAVRHKKEILEALPNLMAN